MPSVKELSNKIRNLQNTKKITSAMKMVAASKLRRAQDAIERSRPYRHEAERLVSRLYGEILGLDLDRADSPWTKSRPIRHATILVCTSDKGLAGTFNNSIIRFVDRFLGLRSGGADLNLTPELAELRRGIVDGQIRCTVHFAGRKGYEALKSRAPVGQYFADVTAKPSYAGAVEIAKVLMADYAAERTDAILLINNRFVSTLTQVPEVRQVFPAALSAGDEPPTSVMLHPDPVSLITTLIPQLITFQVYSALLENAAGEHGARMTAMDSATRNSKDMIDRYTLLKNRARQASITNELIEIISGAESLKG